MILLRTVLIWCVWDGIATQRWWCLLLHSSSSLLPPWGAWRRSAVWYMCSSGFQLDWLHAPACSSMWYKSFQNMRWEEVGPGLELVAWVLDGTWVRIDFFFLLLRCLSCERFLKLMKHQKFCHSKEKAKGDYFWNVQTVTSCVVSGFI